MLTQSIRAALCGMILAMPLPISAHAADEAYCQTYAKSAVEQVNLGRGQPNCRIADQGGRWSGSFRVHFVYCMGHQSIEVENQRAARSDYLRSCGATP